MNPDRFIIVGQGTLIILGIIGSSISTVIKYKDVPAYSAVGASGLVSAFVFAHIFFQPLQKLYFFFAIPIAN